METSQVTKKAEMPCCEVLTQPTAVQVPRIWFSPEVAQEVLPETQVQQVSWRGPACWQRNSAWLVAAWMGVGVMRG